MKVIKYRTELGKNKCNVLVPECELNCPVQQIRDTSTAVDFFNLVIDSRKLAEEYVYMVALAGDNRPLGFFEVSHGVVNRALACPREIFIRLLLAGASSYILFHNHPSGDSTPSGYDIKNTHRLWECSNLMGITLLDHIIAGDTFFSFCENGYLKSDDAHRTNNVAYGG